MRKFIPVWQLAENNSHWSAYLFSAILMLFAMGISSFQREFAHLHIPVFGIPLYIGELVIVVLVISLCFFINTKRVVLSIDGVPARMLLFYFLLGIVFVVSGLKAGYGIAAIRDFAIVYYLVFYFFSAFLIQLHSDRLMILKTIVAGAIIGSIVACVVFFLSPTIKNGHANSSYQALYSWVAVIFLLGLMRGDESWVKRISRVVAIIICGFSIYLSAYRTMIVVMLFSVVLWWGWWFVCRRKRISFDRKIAIWLTVFVSVFIVLVMAHASIIRSFPKPLNLEGSVPLRDAFSILSSRWPRGIINNNLFNEPSADFRFQAWRNALVKIQDNPFLGIGFGPNAELFSDSFCDIVSSPVSNCGNAHNTYLTIAMRMGLPILLFFVWLNCYVVRNFFFYLLSQKTDRYSTQTAVVIFAIYCSVLIYALMSLFFESPYLSTLYWIVLALMTWIPLKVTLKGQSTT